MPTFELFRTASGRTRPPIVTARVCLQLLGFMMALAPVASEALVVKSATVTRNVKKGDGFTIKGEFAGLAFDGAAVVTFELDRSVSGFQIGELTRRKDRLSYKAPRGTPGLVQLVIDVKKRRFAAKAVGLLLEGLPSSLVVRLGADGARDCAVVRLEDKGAARRRGPPKSTRQSLPRRTHGTPCLVLGTPTSDPPAVTVNAPTSVRFEAMLADGAVPTPGSLRVLRLDATGAKTSTPLCTLADDGGAASGDVRAGDGVHTCTATIADSAVTILRLIVEGTVAGAVVESQSFALPVVPPPTDADLTIVLDVQAQARAIWEEQVAALGDTANARHETIRRLAAIAGVAEAALSPDGLDVVIRFTSGHLGGLMLSPRFGDADVTATQHRTETRVSKAADRTAVASAAIVCSLRPERTLIGNHRALLLKTPFFGAADDWQIAKAAIEGSCLPFDAVAVLDLTVASLLTITQYSTVMLSTHGIVGRDGRVAIVTTESANPTLLAQYRRRFDEHQLYIVGLPAGIPTGGRDVFAVTPKFIAAIPGEFDHALVHASHCWGALDPSEGAAFIAKGAATFFGFDALVSHVFARRTTHALFRDLAQNLFTTGSAYARAVKVDPSPQTRPALGKGLWYVRQPPARLLMQGDPRLAYVGEPELAPARSEVGRGGEQVLTTSVERSDGCALEYAWGFLGDGTLTDADGHTAPPPFDGTRASATFHHDPDGLGGENGVNVGTRAPAGADGGQRPIFGSTCAVVVVRVCGDGIKEDGEECDAGDAAACPGNCRNDCTCVRCGDDRIDPGEICDGTNKDICDQVSAPRPGYCRPDCKGCAVCSDGVVDPNEQCELTSDAACPGACHTDCTCGCAPGDPAGCAANLCCHPQTRTCCTPIANGIDPGCGFVAHGCCGDPAPIEPCHAPGESPPPMACPAPDCQQGFYYCQWCDGKLIETILSP